MNHIGFTVALNPMQFRALACPVYNLFVVRGLPLTENLEGSPNGMAPLLKSGGRKPLEVRVLYPPQTSPLLSVAHTDIIIIMRTTQRKGDIAVSKAIARFTTMDYDVALPLTESASYDLIVDTGKELKRVQVRYTSTGEVALRRIHSNSKGYVVKKTKADAYDWLYVFKNTGEEYLVKKCLANRNSIRPTTEYRLN